MPVSGKLEVTIKINEFPADARTVQNNLKQFDINTGDYVVTVTVKPKVFKKLEEAHASFPLWVASIVGKIGEGTDDGFVLDEPAIQVFERKPKEAKEETKESA